MKFVYFSWDGEGNIVKNTYICDCSFYKIVPCSRIKETCVKAVVNNKLVIHFFFRKCHSAQILVGISGFQPNKIKKKTLIFAKG